MTSSDTHKKFNKFEAAIEINGTPDSPAIALANKVLPVPGGPINKTLGTLHRDQ